jgi:DNA mismatch repair ATPase MutS
VPKKVLNDFPWVDDSLLVEEDIDLDIVEKVERFTAPRCKQAEVLLAECKDEIVNLRVELSKEMREQTWMQAEILRLHVLLNECRRKEMQRILYEGEG